MKLRSLLVLVACIFLLNSHYAQTLFSKVYSQNYEEYLSNSIIGLSDGSVIISGYHNSKNLIMRVDRDGEITWTKSIGYGDYESGALYKIDDSTLVMAASSTAEATDFFNLFCVKMNDNGDTLWTRTYDFYDNVSVNWIEQTQDSGFIIAGEINRNEAPYEYILIVKLDNEGYYQWSKVISGGNSRSSALSVGQSDIDSSYYITGQYTDANPYKSYAFLMKIDINGEIQFSKTYTLPDTDYSFAAGNSLLVDNNGILVLINVGSNCFLKTDFDGNIIWKEAGFNSGWGSCPFDIRKHRITKFGNSEYKFLSGDHIYETDSLGNINHVMGFEMCTSDYVTNNGITTVSGNGPMIGVKNNTNPQIGLINYDSIYQTSGICVWETYDSNYDIELITDNHNLDNIVHDYQQIFNSYEISTSNLDIENKCVAFIGSVNDISNDQFSIYPVPTSGVVNINGDAGVYECDILVYDINGRLVAKYVEFRIGGYINLSELPNGVYNIKIITNTSENHRIILQK